ncbi:MAG: N-acetylmuramoyl-L-alanine amidase [candidate division KSB1 bacterium]|nr:N-acetylmuramoyl-L-alanine amidase [candidate division KSB1 bacterium]
MNFTRSCAALLLFTVGTISAIDVYDRTTNSFVGKLTALTFDGCTYFPIEELENFSLPVEVNSRSKQAVLQYGPHRIKLTAFTPFIEIDGKRMQLRRDIVMRHGEILLPLEAFASAMQKAGVFSFIYKSEISRLELQLLTPSIVSLRNQSLEDGCLIVLQCKKAFQASQIKTSVEGDWIRLTIQGGIFAKADLSYQPPLEVFEYAVDYLGNETSKLSLHTAPGVSLVSVEAAPSLKEIHIRLKRSVNNISVLKELEEARRRWLIDKIIIDPGHGGKDPGCVGSGRVYEKHITLAIARALQEELCRRLNVEVLLTRSSDVFVPLKQRTQFANQSGGKLFISIHVDANRVKRLRGHTIYFLGPAKTEAARAVAQMENSVIRYEDNLQPYEGLSDAAFILAMNAQNSFNKESEDLAAMIDSRLEQRTGVRGFGVKQAGFYVLYGASMPNILIETGFMTNAEDARNLTSEAYQKKIAAAVCDAVIQFKEKYEQPGF